MMIASWSFAQEASQIIWFTITRDIKSLFIWNTSRRINLQNEQQTVPWKEGNGTQTNQCIQAQPTPGSLEAEEKFMDIVSLVS